MVPVYERVSLMSSSSMSQVGTVNRYKAQTFSFTLVTLLYSVIFVVACCTCIYYRDLTYSNVISTDQ